MPAISLSLSMAWCHHIKNLLIKWPGALHLFYKLPQSCQEKDEYFNLLNSDCQLQVISKLCIDTLVLSDAWCMRIKDLLARSPNQLTLFRKLPQSFQEQEEYFSLLDKFLKVNLTCEYLIEKASYYFWSLLKTDEKVFCIFKIAQNYEVLEISNILIILIESHKVSPENNLIVALLKLLRCKIDSKYRSYISFDDIDKLICEYICEEAHKSKDNDVLLDMGGLFLECAMRKLKYCEAKIWKRDEYGDIAWCTKLRTHCSTYQPSSSENHGAIIGADLDKNWSNWTFVELLTVAKILPKTSKQKDLKIIHGYSESLVYINHYISKLSSWVNKIRDMQNRMRCQYCSRIMPHDINYSKFSFVNNVTIFHCLHSKTQPLLPHDKDVYINQCWGCDHVIDSRESKVKQIYMGVSYYVCIDCGSGHKKQKPGKICPNCGYDYSYLPSYANCTKECPMCHHKIKLPAPWKMEKFEI